MVGKMLTEVTEQNFEEEVLNSDILVFLASQLHGADIVSQHVLSLMS